MNFRFTTLMSRLVGYFLLISLLTMALVAGTAYHLAREALKESVFERLGGVVENKTMAITNWVNSQRREIISLAGDSQTKSYARKIIDPGKDRAEAEKAYVDLRGIFRTLVAHKPNLREVFLMSNRGGQVVLSTNRSMEGEFRVNDKSFIFGRQSTYTQNVYPSPVTLNPIMTVATPLIGARGRRFGVLAADLDLERMDKIILRQTGLGRTGEAYLVDKLNVFVSASRFGAGNYLRGVHSPGISAAVRGESGRGTYKNYKGIPVIGVYRWIKDLELALLVEIHQEEAFAPARRLAGTIGLLGLASALILALGVFFLARQIARPILAISKAASNVASGDLTARAPVMTGDEIGTLAQGFNQMAARLDKLYRGMEEKVEQLEETESALRESERYYREIFENDLTGDFVADAAGVILSSNPALARILGFETEPPDPPLHLSQFWTGAQTFEDFLKTLTQEKNIAYQRMVMQRFDGQPIHVVANFVPVLNEDGSLKGIRGYLFDDTKRLELEEQLRHSQKMEALGRLAGGVAHDFNNLMTAVTGYSDLALANLEKDDPLRAGIEQIAKAGERAASLTRQLLVFSRRQVLKLKVVDLNLIVIETEKMIRRLLGEDIEIITRLDPDLGRVRADDGQLQQVIMNLVINARDAMPDGGLLTIETKSNSSGTMPDRTGGDPGDPGFVRLSVSDTGVGMDPEIQSRVFDPFFTTKEQGKGTGLGLATVHGVIKQSGGRILIDSEPGCGSVFHVILPRVDGETEHQDQPPSTIPTSANKETVLLVEDEDVVRNLTREILELSGYDVLAASNAQEALEIARSEGDRVGLLLTDVIMPGLSGPELALELRDERPELKVLFISGYTDKDLWPGGLKKRGSAFVPKPFKPADLVSKIRRLLDETD